MLFRSDSASAGDSGNMTPMKFVPNTSTPRFCLDESLLFQFGISGAMTTELLFAFADLPRSSEDVSNLYSKISIFSSKFFTDMLNSSDGFIEKLVKIYVDLCDEATKFCHDDNAALSIVTPARLTKNGKLDGAIVQIGRAHV